MVQVGKIRRRHLSGSFAEDTLKTASTIYELHQRTHVGLAPIAPHRTFFPKITQWQGTLTRSLACKRADAQGKRKSCLSQHLWCARHTIDGRTNKSRAADAFIMHNKVSCDQWWNLAPLICVEGTTVGVAIILYHLDWTRHLIRVKFPLLLLLLRRWWWCRHRGMARRH